MPTILFENKRADDGTTYVNVQATPKHTHKHGELVTWKIINRTGIAIPGVKVIDFYPLGNGVTPCRTLPTPVNVLPSGTQPDITMTADGDTPAPNTTDAYKYSIVANGFLVKDPELDIDP